MIHQFRLIMLSAMYENGGNVTHRFLDGHPQLFVYPFESQLGTRYVSDFLSSMYPVKYRWPVFSLSASPYQDYKAIIDEETKVRGITPHVSKFRHMPMDFSDDERCRIYQDYVKKTGRSTGTNVMAFFKATFDAWKDYKRTGEETAYLGYSPIIIVDAEKIITDLAQSHVIHIVRNPWSAYGDTKKRPVPISIAHYMAAWTQNQYYALLYKEKYPDRIHLLRLEDILADPEKTLGELLETLGLGRGRFLKYPTWNSNSLDEVYPWGTIRHATPEANRKAAEALCRKEQEEIRWRASLYLESFDFKDFIS